MAYQHVLLLLLLGSRYHGNDANIICESNGTTDYAYNLPQRNIISCPSFQTFTFSCHTYHVINVDSLKFSPYSPHPNGECSSDWQQECKDDSYALQYLKNKCSSRESCSVHANELRTKTKCLLNEVISISYKCIPTWEVIEVPIKCDVCKNVTFTSGDTPNFGFLHSNYYSHHQVQHLSCVSQIQNKPDHIIVIYSVNGYIGPDKILVETYNDYGVYINQVITGNISTNLVMTSNYNVNITVLPETYEVFKNPHFLLYYYVVPKCEYMLCPVPTPTNPPPTYPTLPPSTTTTTTTTTTVEQSSIAPPLIADKNKNKGGPASVSDAWLAAILGLVYACLMIFAVLAAVYFRRRRKRNSMTDAQVILSPSMVTQSRVMSGSINQSNISLSEASIRAHSAYGHELASKSATEYNRNFSRNEQTYEEFDSRHEVLSQQKMHASIGNVRATNGDNDFDIFSHVVASDEMESNMFGAGNIHQAQRMAAEYHSHQRISSQERSELGSTIYPQSYSIRGTDMSTLNSNGNMWTGSDANAGYRVVEYSRSPDGERVRVTTEELITDAGDISSQALNIDRIHSSALEQSRSQMQQQQQSNTHISAYSHQESKKTIALEDSSNLTTVQLYPTCNETQEMTMYVENSHEDLNTGRMFKIDLNK